MNKFKFFLVALTATAMMFSSCKKDEKGDEPNPTPTENPSDVETPKNTETIVVTAPEVVYPKQYQYVGVVDKIDFKWEEPTVKKVSHVYDETTKSYNDTETELTDCSFKYELCYSTDGTTWETSDKVSEPKFTKNVTLEKEKTYYYKINTYISYGNTKDSLIEKYEYKFDDDVTIPFYSTYEQKHHFGVIRSTLINDNIQICLVFSWAEGCVCKFSYYSVVKDSYGKYNYHEFGREKTISDENTYYGYLQADIDLAVKYELSGKYNEKGILHLKPVDGKKQTYDGDFNVYDKNKFMNTDKQYAVYPKDAKTQYLEPMFEYAASGRLKRYNPCTYAGEIVAYENWKEFSEGLSDAQFMINYQRLLGATEENTTYPFLKNGEFLCYDQDFDGVDYESRNFDKNCGLIELTEDFSDENYEDWSDIY